LWRGTRSEFEERDIVVGDVQKLEAGTKGQMKSVNAIVIGSEVSEFGQGVGDGNVGYIIPSTVK